MVTHNGRYTSLHSGCCTGSLRWGGINVVVVGGASVPDGVVVVVGCRVGKGKVVVVNGCVVLGGVVVGGGGGGIGESAGNTSTCSTKTIPVSPPVHESPVPFKTTRTVSPEDEFVFNVGMTQGSVVLTMRFSVPCESWKQSSSVNDK